MRPDRLGIVVDPAVDLIRVDGREMAAAQIWVRPGAEEVYRTSDDVATLIAALLHQKGIEAVLWRLPGNSGACAFLFDPDDPANIRRSRIFPTKDQFWTSEDDKQQRLTAVMAKGRK